MDIGCPDSPESEPYDDESNRSGGEPSSPHDSEEPLDLSRSPISCMDSGPEDDEDEEGVSRRWIRSQLHVVRRE